MPKRFNKPHRFTARAFAALACLWAPPLLADPGVHDDRIVLGQSAALQGPAAALGRDFKQGLELAFAEVNASGGVHGRRLELIAYDDSYEPTQAIANTERLLEEDRVFALVGEVGTPTSRAVLPVAVSRGAPFIAPLTGAEFLRDPKLTTVINLRASYNQEAERGVAHLVERLGLDRIAVLFQDDTFGRDGLAAVSAALARRGLAPVGDATYKRNTTAVKRAALDLRSASPQAVFIIGAYRPAAEFIRVSRFIGFEPRFIALSFVGSQALADELGGAGQGVIISQVVPPPGDTDRALVRRFHAALAQHGHGQPPGFVVLEGYLAGRLMVTALATMPDGPTRAGLLAALRSGAVPAVDGFPLRFGADSNQGSDQVFLTELRADGTLEEISP